MNGYNSTKDSLRNPQTHLRNPHFETPEGGQIREEGREKRRDGCHGHSPELTAVPGERRIQAAIVLSMAPSILTCDQHIILAEPSNWGRDLRAEAKYRSATAVFL